MKEPEATQDYRTIDGNYAKAVIGYCTYHRGYVTDKQAKIHRCHRKHGGTCGRLKNMKGEYIRKMKTDQFYDKVIDRLDKLIGAVNKLTRTLEAMQKVKDGMIVSLTDASNVHLEAIDSDSHYGKITIE